MRSVMRYGQSKMKEEKKKQTLLARDVAIMGMMVCTMEVGKLALSMVPNVEVVSFLIILYTIYFGRKTIYGVVAFVLIECAIWGLGPWTFMYLYIWPLLSIVAYLFRKVDSKWFWSVFSAVFGLLFGPLCSLTYLVTGGPYMAFTWWIAGIPWDILHGVANFVIMTVLYTPMVRLMKRIGA